ncbi:hypothetical protein GWK47_030260 [Chionoecetes opilio]|uniref:Uncharacterized protein n=1 Tax=Chionoecetes opilio TaxID=41210 RepID=A0A8J4YK64_CHIOP|nr:hypothetical protein GWK47_030260 [Chionoecetes opilio]
MTSVSMDNLRYSIPYKDNMIPTRKRGREEPAEEPLYQPWVRKRGLHYCVPTGRPRPCKWEREQECEDASLPKNARLEEMERRAKEMEQKRKAKVEAVRQKMEMEREVRTEAERQEELERRKADVLWEEVRGMTEAEQDTLIKVKRKEAAKARGRTPAA